jgi:hypothetical protein
MEPVNDFKRSCLTVIFSASGRQGGKTASEY